MELLLLRNSPSYCVGASPRSHLLGVAAPTVNFEICAEWWRVVPTSAFVVVFIGVAAPTVKFWNHPHSNILVSYSRGVVDRVCTRIEYLRRELLRVHIFILYGLSFRARQHRKRSRIASRVEAYFLASHVSGQPVRNIVSFFIRVPVQHSVLTTVTPRSTPFVLRPAETRPQAYVCPL